MRSRIVILQDSLLADDIESWKGNGVKDLVPVSQSCQVAFDMVQGGAVVGADACPHHYRPSSVPIVLPDGCVSETLTCTAPDANPTVVEGQSEPRLIGKEHVRPLLGFHLTCALHQFILATL